VPFLFSECLPKNCRSAPFTNPLHWVVRKIERIEASLSTWTCHKHNGQQGNCWFDLSLMSNQACEWFSVCEHFQNENNICKPIFDWFTKSVHKCEPFLHLGTFWKSVHVLCPFAWLMTRRFVNRFLMNLSFCGPFFSKRFTIVVLFMNRFLWSPFAKEITIVHEPICKWVVALHIKAKCQRNCQQGCSRFQELLLENLSHQNSGPTKCWKCS